MARIVIEAVETKPGIYPVGPEVDGKQDTKEVETPFWTASVEGRVDVAVQGPTEFAACVAALCEHEVQARGGLAAGSIVVGPKDAGKLRKMLGMVG